MIEPADDIALDLAEAREKLEAARRLLEAQGDQLTEVVERLRRLEEAVAKVEGDVTAGAAEVRS